MTTLLRTAHPVVSVLPLSVRRAIVAGLATTAIAGSFALLATGAMAASSRDCKLYGHCDYLNGYNSFQNSYQSSEPTTAQPVRPAKPTSGFQIHEESGISGPRGHNWESTGKGWEY